MAETGELRFLNRGTKEELEAGTLIFDFQDPCSDGDIFYLISGSVEIETSVQDVRLSNRILYPGAIFGAEEPYGKKYRRIHRAKALRDSVVYRWKRRAFDDAMGIYQELATDVIKSLSRNLRDLNRAKAKKMASA